VDPIKTRAHRAAGARKHGWNGHDVIAGDNAKRGGQPVTPGGLFHVRRGIPRPFEESELHHFRARNRCDAVSFNSSEVPHPCFHGLIARLYEFR
jgi:hypothetical protein